MATQKTPSNIACIHAHETGTRLRSAAAAQLIIESFRNKTVQASDYIFIETIIQNAMSLPLYTKGDDCLGSISRDTDGRITKEPRRRS